MNASVVFPGQGTHAPGMGAPWRDHPAWGVVERAEAALGEPVAGLLLDASADDLSRTRNAQLAVLVTSLVAWEAVRTQIGTPVAFAGHSLGQVSALIASGTLGFDDGIRFAAARATATQEAADAHPGRMAALMGADLDQADAVCAKAPEACWIANDNAPGQVVIAGTPHGLDTAVAGAKDAGVRRAVPLDVGGAFHTPLMDDATEALRGVLADVEFSTPSAPVVSNLDARGHTDADWREPSARHVSQRVRWRESLLAIEALGTDTLVEVGHGSMIAALAKRTTPDLTVIGVGSPAELADVAS